MKIDALTRRSELLRTLRNFFYDGGFIEVETPVVIAAPAPEENIESLTAERGFLRTSPELAMKELLADGVERMFQLGSAFRHGEMGRRHREEFTILEYYAVGWDYLKLADFTFKLIAGSLKQVSGRSQLSWQGQLLDLGKVEYIRVEDAYLRYAGVSPFGLEAEEFDRLMVEKIEPCLGQGQLTFLYDYPLEYAALSQRSQRDCRVAERWELYGCGLELGNAFGELTDAAEQKARFEAAYRERQARGMRAYPEPEGFYRALDKGIPASSGCAIGVDRVVMLLLDAYSIDEVRAF